MLERRNTEILKKLTNYKVIISEAEKKIVGRGRPEGGLILAIKKEIIQDMDEEVRCGKEFIGMKVKIKDHWMKIGVTYMRHKREENWKLMENWANQDPEELILVGGDFNARTGEESVQKGHMEQELFRSSKDEKKDNWGAEMLEELAALGWNIFNGCTEGDEEGEITYTCERGKSVIDYIVGNEKGWSMIRRMEIKDRIESDHLPIIIHTGFTSEEKKERKIIETQDWTKEGIEEFRKKLREAGRAKDWADLKRKIQQSVKVTKEEINMENKLEDWSDKECWDKKTVTKAVHISEK